MSKIEGFFLCCRLIINESGTADPPGNEISLLPLPPSLPLGRGSGLPPSIAIAALVGGVKVVGGVFCIWGGGGLAIGDSGAESASGRRSAKFRLCRAPKRISFGVDD